MQENRNSKKVQFRNYEGEKEVTAENKLRLENKISSLQAEFEKRLLDTDC